MTMESPDAAHVSKAEYGLGSQTVGRGRESIFPAPDDPFSASPSADLEGRLTS